MGSLNLKSKSSADKPRVGVKAGFRMIYDSVLGSVESVTGLNITAESKRMARIGMARKPTFRTDIRRYSGAAKSERSTPVEKMVDVPLTEKACVEETTDVQVVEEIVEPEFAEKISEEQKDVFVDELEVPAVIEQPVTENVAATSDCEVVEVFTEQRFDFSEENINEVDVFEPEDIPAVEETEDPYFTDLYETLAADIIVNEVMPELVPEVFVEPPEYVISEFAEFESVEVSVEIYDPFIDDLCETLAADIIVNEVMPELVPEAFIEPPEYVISEFVEFSCEETSIEIYDPFIEDICETLAADIIVNEVMPELVPEAFIEPPEYVISEFAEFESVEVSVEIYDPFIEDICETLAADIIVNEVMPELVPEAFIEPPEYVISEFTEFESAETSIEIYDPFIEDICETLAADIIVNEVMPELVPEAFVEPSDPFIDDICETLTADIIVNEVMPELVPEAFIEPSEHVISEFVEFESVEVSVEIYDPFIDDVCESLAADIIVSDIMPELVPEAFTEPPEYVISEFTEFSQEETEIEFYDPFIDDVCESLAADIIVSDIMPELVPEAFEESTEEEIAVPEVTVAEEIEDVEIINTVSTTFNFAFVATSQVNKGSRFNFIIGNSKPIEENDDRAVDEVIRNSTTEQGILVKPPF